MSTLPAVTMDELELENAELLPSRETLCCNPCRPPCFSVYVSVNISICVVRRQPVLQHYRRR